MEIQLKKFDITQIKDDKVVVLIGKRDTGKSFLCKDILYYHNDTEVLFWKHIYLAQPYKRAINDPILLVLDA